MFVELFGPLVGLPAEWRGQGASDDEIALRAFGFDHVSVHTIAVHTGYWPETAEVVVSDDDVTRVFRDGMGRTMRLPKRAATIALPMDFPVKTPADWEKIRSRYEFSADRFATGWAEQARAAQASGSLVRACIVGGYDEVRQLMGDEEACAGFLTQPELIGEMIDTFRVLNRELLSRISAEVQIDQLSVHEDFAGNNGPLIGPNVMETFICPYYADAWDCVRHTAGIFGLDSDGNINPIIDQIVAAGVNELHPMEPAAGMDIVAMRERYGTAVRFKGGIDKYVVTRSREAIDQELSYKLQPMMQTGGIAFGLDHRVPNGTPIHLYRYYVSRARELLGLDPDLEFGWGRMAF